MKLIINYLLITAFFCIVSCTNRNAQTSSRDYEKETLLRLINKRLEMAPLVAKSKWNTKMPIDDYAREKTILDNVEGQAKEIGVNEKFARNFFTAQFEAGKQVQRQLHKQWQIQNHPLFNPAPDLSAEVRPVLDSLTPLLLKEIAKIKPNSCKTQYLKGLRKAARKTISSNFNDQVVETALQPVKDYCTHHEHYKE